MKNNFCETDIFSLEDFCKKYIDNDEFEKAIREKLGNEVVVFWDVNDCETTPNDDLIMRMYEFDGWEHNAHIELIDKTRILFTMFFKKTKLLKCTVDLKNARLNGTKIDFFYAFFTKTEDFIKIFVSSKNIIKDDVEKILWMTEYDTVDEFWNVYKGKIYGNNYGI